MAGIQQSEVVMEEYLPNMMYTYLWGSSIVSTSSQCLQRNHSSSTLCTAQIEHLMHTTIPINDFQHMTTRVNPYSIEEAQNDLQVDKLYELLMELTSRALLWLF